MSARGRRKTGGGIRQKFTILPSCTKRVVMQLARDMGISLTCGSFCFQQLLRSISQP